MDWSLALAGLIVGVVVGLTGMGGGALMTPILVLVFKVEPLAAVSSDLVASFFMKPVGALVHIRRRTVNWKLVQYLCIGSVPAAFAGVFVLRALGAADLQDTVKKALGAALLLAAAGLIGKTYLTLRERAQRRSLGLPAQPVTGRSQILVRPLPTILIGAVGGLVVGMTSVGSGSLIIIALLMLYPVLHASQLVGTDLVQAVPLVAAAAVGHLLYGDFQVSLTASLLVGCMPGVYLGARMSAGAPGGLVRRALALVLLASGLKLVGVGTTPLAWTLGLVVVVGSLAWMQVRRSHGLPALARREIRAPAPQAVDDPSEQAVAPEG
ncbi:MAG: sulfite exporter TauE/SafE family protein [Nocardioidaceae bacterium]